MRKPVLKNNAHTLAKLLAVLLTGTVLSVQALTLGDVQGDPVIGQPLDLSIHIQASPGEELSAGCVSADIYYAEARQKAPQITTHLTTLRLQLPAVIDEPVVTVLIRTFCGASQIRRYVLLADLPPSISATVVPMNNQPVAGLPSSQSGLSNAGGVPDVVVLPQRTVADTSTAALPAARSPVSSARKIKKTAKKQKPKSPKAKITRDRKQAIAAPAKSMLKLDPLEILSDRMDTLDAPMLFAPTEDALLQSKQIASLQADLKSMQELAVKNDSALLELRSQLQQAKVQQIPMTLVYGLIALVMLCLAGLAWLWQGQRKLNRSAHAWWQNPADDELAAVFQPKDASPPSGYGSAPPFANSHTETQTAKLPIPTQANPEVRIRPHKLNPESVQDIRQQADFFVSLGQPQRAIQLLAQQIATADLPNPLLCLNLLGLYQSDGLTTEFNQLRDTCHQHFNVQLPDLATFQQEGQDLTSYPDVLATLTRLWPGEHAQAFMDTCIFLHAKPKFQAAFDLAAFRELLTLHAIAEELESPSDSSKKGPLPSIPLDLDFTLLKDTSEEVTNADLDVKPTPR